jgi:hypothetical protein
MNFVVFFFSYSFIGVPVRAALPIRQECVPSRGVAGHNIGTADGDALARMLLDFC